MRVFVPRARRAGWGWQAARPQGGGPGAPTFQRWHLVPRPFSFHLEAGLGLTLSTRALPTFWVRPFSATGDVGRGWGAAVPALQDVEQHPWPLPTGCQQQPSSPKSRQPKMSAVKATCPGGRVPGSRPVRNHRPGTPGVPNERAPQRRTAPEAGSHLLHF